MSAIKKIITGLIFLFCAYESYAQMPDFSWAHAGTGTNYNYVSGIKKDISGNILVAGGFYDTLTFGTQTLSSLGYSDSYLAKYDPYGNLLSAVNLGTTGYDDASGIAVDYSDNIIIAGHYSSPPTLYDQFIYINKYYPGGGIQWQQVVRPRGYAAISHVATNISGDIFISGNYLDSIQFGNYIFLSPSFYDNFLVKYTSAGQVLWAKNFYPSPYDDIHFAPTGSDLIVGGSYSINDFQQMRFFYSKYDNLGNVVWRTDVTGEGSASLSTITTDAAGNFYIAGIFDSVLVLDNQTFTTSGQKIFLAKFQPNGTLTWFVYMNYTNDDFIYDVAVDAAMNVYVIGNSIPLEVNTMFLQKYSRDGIMLWGTHFSDISLGTDLEIDNTGRVIAAGRFETQLNLGNFLLTSPGPGIFTALLPAPVLPYPVMALDFGPASVGGYTTKTFSIANPTMAPMRLLSFNLTGDPDFQIVSGSETGTIPPQQSRDVTISFIPSVTGTRNANLAVVTDAANGDLSVGITGIGSNTGLQFSASNLDFGNVMPPDSAFRNLTIYNTGLIDILIYNISITGDSEGNFAIVNPGQISTIAAMDSAIVRIRFSPLTEGLKTAAIEIQNNSPTMLYYVNVSGNAISGIFPDSINVGYCSIGDTLTYIVTINNSGISDLNITGLNFYGAASSDFSIGISVPLPPIPPQGYAQIPVLFHPVTVGTRNAFLVAVSNSPGSPDTIFIKGSAIYPLQVVIIAPDTAVGIRINISPPPQFTFTNNYLYYRRTGTLGYTEIPFTFSSGTYSAVIPPELIDIRGIEYYAVFTGDTLTLTYPPDNPDTKPAFYPIKYQQVSAPVLMQPLKYRMVSIPLGLDNNSFAEQFDDDFGSYNPKIWRLLEWSSTDTTYKEFPDFSHNITPGKGFWLINASGTGFDFANAQSVPPVDPFIIKLAPGWNQVGNPWLFSVLWDFENPLVSPPIVWYPDSSVYLIDQFLLEPWTGYWVYNEGTDSTSVGLQPIEMFSGAGKPAGPVLADNEFLLNVEASVKSLNLHDGKISVGMISNPGGDIRRKSCYKPPAVDHDFDLGIINDNKRYLRSFKEVSEGGAFWDFNIHSVHKDIQVDVKLQRIKDLPEGFSIWVIDLAGNVSIPLYKDMFTIKLSAGGESFFRLIAGTRDFALQNAGSASLIPAEFTVYQNYPNPFNPATMLAFSIPDKGNVEVKVYDIVGREINTLLNQESEPGIHEVRIDLSDYASGIYICTIKYKSSLISRKLVLTK